MASPNLAGMGGVRKTAPPTVAFMDMPTNSSPLASHSVSGYQN